ncbi:hypothetical protein [Companilactobacillus muriivasis]|uniref:hypothetical protein n=1 Tax=Companilactobacillus muriivasis TaxID=3081444 RepID=UPI0030C6DD5F
MSNKEEKDHINSLFTSYRREKFPGDIYWENGKIMCNDGRFISTVFDERQIIALNMIIDCYLKSRK